jgi:signal peptidase II
LGPPPQYGAAFSFLADVGGWQQPLFIGLALVISILLVYWLWRSPRVLSYRLALSAILGGALGNVADRLRLGYVEDFLDFHYAQWHWPSFNLADVWIFLGVALYLGGNTTSTRQPPPLNRPASSLSHA